MAHTKEMTRGIVTNEMKTLLLNGVEVKYPPMGIRLTNPHIITTEGSGTYDPEFTNSTKKVFYWVPTDKASSLDLHVLLWGGLYSIPPYTPISCIGFIDVTGETPQDSISIYGPLQEYSAQNNPVNKLTVPLIVPGPPLPYFQVAGLTMGSEGTLYEVDFVD